jgi:hypothetical protein
MPPKAPKATKLKGPALAHTTLEALLDTYGTHRVEALAGRAAQSAQRAVDALNAPDFSHHDALRIADTARLLATRGHADAATRIADALVALADPNWAAAHVVRWRRSRSAHVAAVYAALGDAARASPLLDDALALSPDWTAPRTSPYAGSLHDDEAAARMALTLLDLGREDTARAILDNLYASSIRDGIRAAARAGDAHRLRLFQPTIRPGQQSLGEQIVDDLLAGGHLALVDLYLPEALASPYCPAQMRHRWPLDRLLAHSVAAFDARFVEFARALSSLAPSDATAQLPSLGAVLLARVARQRDGIAPLREALRDALSAVADRLCDQPPFWITTRALREAGGDVLALCEAATTPAARGLAIAHVLPTTYADAPDALRAALVAHGATIDGASLTHDDWLQRAAIAALLRAGEFAVATPLANTAADVSRANASSLSELASAAMLGGDLALTWEITARATKAKRPGALAHVRYAMAQHGALDLYWTACQALAPTLHERDHELALLIEGGARALT